MIERNIFVTKESIVQPIAYVENTNMIPIVLHIRDYNLPEGSVARAYAAMQSNTVILCEISGNDVIIPVVSGFFARGENTLQIRIVQGESRLLISFPIKVNVKRDITGSDASEPHDNPSVMDQLVAKYGEIEERLNSWDTKENTVTFESSDEETPDSWTDVEVLKTGEKHSSLFAKISTMFKNIRYIYTHFIKSEDILDTLEEIIANTEKGKVAGALAVKQLNSNFNNYEIKILTSTETTSNAGTFSFNYTNELPNGGTLLLAYTANSNYWCKLYGLSNGNCVLGIADFNNQNSANIQHTVYSYWLVKKS